MVGGAFVGQRLLPQGLGGVLPAVGQTQQIQHHLRGGVGVRGDDGEILGDLGENRLTGLIFRLLPHQRRRNGNHGQLHRIFPGGGGFRRIGRCPGGGLGRGVGPAAGAQQSGQGQQQAKQSFHGRVLPIF